MLDITFTYTIVDELVTNIRNADINFGNISLYKCQFNVIEIRMIQHRMLYIYPKPMNIYQLKQRPISADIIIGNFDHDVVEYNTGKSDIACQLCHAYIYQAPKLQIFTKHANKNVGNIPWHFFFSKLFFSYGNLTLNVGYYLHIYSIQ